MPVDPSALSKFQSMAGSLKNRRANRGEGAFGNWPPDGEHMVIVTSFDVKQGKFDIDQRNNNSVPCLVGSFSYELVRDTQAPDYDPSAPAVQFSGRRMDLLNPEGVKFPPPKAGSDKHFLQIRVEQALERFMGFAQVLLGMTEEEVQQSDPVELVRRLDEKINKSGNSVTATIKLTTRRYDKKDPKTGVVTGQGEEKADYALELHSS